MPKIRLFCLATNDTRAAPASRLPLKTLEARRFANERFSEIILVNLLLAFTLPLMAVVALAIKYESPGPIFARSERVGIGGRRFDLLKFPITRHNPEHAPWTQDVTRVSEFLVRTRIEDLPQLFNVLRRKMSLLADGPERPHFFV